LLKIALSEPAKTFILSICIGGSAVGNSVWKQARSRQKLFFLLQAVFDINAVQSVSHMAGRNYIPDFISLVGEVLTYVQTLSDLSAGVKGLNGHIL